MRHNDDAFATILLMSQITPDREELVLPLSASEYHQLRRDVRESSLVSLGRLIDLDMSGMVQYLSITEQEAYRLCMLMSRTLPLSMSIERFYDLNIDLLTLDDRGYPDALLEKLNFKAPPMLYFSGRPELFRQQAIAVLGAAGPAGEAEGAVRALVKDAVRQDYVIITDGTEGLGRIAEDEAFLRGGRVIEVLPGAMAERLRDERIADAVNKRMALLLSVTHPDAPYTLSHALKRNKLIYALSTAAFVFAADEKRGATWDGAAEALRNRWCEFLYARDTPLYPGNRALIARGALSYNPETGAPFSQMSDNWASATAEQLTLFDWKEPRML